MINDATHEDHENTSFFGGSGKPWGLLHLVGVHFWTPRCCGFSLDNCLALMPIEETPVDEKMMKFWGCERLNGFFNGALTGGGLRRMELEKVELEMKENTQSHAIDEAKIHAALDVETLETKPTKSERAKKGRAKKNAEFKPAKAKMKGANCFIPEKTTKAGQGLQFSRYFTQAGENPYDKIEWNRRDAVITNEHGEKVFEQIGVEIPKAWSMLATNVVVSKYFRGKVGTPEREHSVRQLIGRVADTMTQWGKKDGFFADAEDAKTFNHELTFLLLNQHVAFNSPVWFNVGIETHPQCSACFINAAEDNMASILELAKTEGMLFKHGSGTGSNLSKIRSSKESLAGGGESSGPVSFMKGFDAFAGVIKSGGKTRRAAKMVILDIDHPDIQDFIDCKLKEEKKAWALIDEGYDGSFNGEAYNSIFFQNANHSVRVTDEFMRAVVEDREWSTYEVTTGKPSETFRAKDLMRRIAEGTHVCGDPGMQYDTTINEWHTCKNSDRIYASNPCSEYMFLDNTACNLASLNLMKFTDEYGNFDVHGFRHASDVVLTAMEIIVSNASYPTEQICSNSEDYRPLGLGFANLGALLMDWGLPYDSDGGRDVAGAITGLMCGQAFLTSARIAADRGAFNAYEKNRQPMLNVIRKHRHHVSMIDDSNVPADLMAACRAVWDDALTEGVQNGFRNSQVTVLAPTGTIGFMMDCDTTGVEPDIALVKYKKLVGGGLLKIVNQAIPHALSKLGYNEKEVEEIINYVHERETIEGAPLLKAEHLPIFDCAFKPLNGERTIHYRGHLRMMAAAQPFLSGAISKTVNVPQDASVEDIEKAYIEGWKLGLKALAVYRDGSKRTQPLNTGASKSDTKQPGVKTGLVAGRKKLPAERKSLTHKFSIGGHEGYITAGLFEDGTPGEIFIVMAKEGSTISGLMDSFATAISLALQYGVPAETLIDKFAHTRFEPSGFTQNKKIPMAKSVMDYIFRWLATHFCSPEKQQSYGIQLSPEDMALLQTPETVDAVANDTALTPNTATPTTNEQVSNTLATDHRAIGFSLENATTGKAQGINLAPIHDQDAPSCSGCGSIMVRNGACYKCINCGDTSGCS